MAKIERNEDGSIVLTIDLPKNQVAKTREEVIEDVVKNAKVEGFRPGKAPRNLVEQNINHAQLNEEILKKLLPASYMAAVQEHNIRPIINPKIHIEKLEDNADWTFTATTCEAPEIKLNDYKKKVGAITAKSKIAIPGKEKQEPNFDELMKAVIDAAEVKIPPILVDGEVDRLLAQTLDEIKRLGITLEQYLSSTGKTVEQLRSEYAAKAASDIKVEFVLQKIAEDEKITVDEKEIEEAITKAKDETERHNLQNNRYLLASILRQQKTLDFIKSL